MAEAEAHFQHKRYDVCLLNLHMLTHAGNSGNQEAQALTAMCKIHKHAAFQEWHKVTIEHNGYGLFQHPALCTVLPVV